MNLREHSLTIIVILGILIFTFSLSPLLKLIFNTSIPLAVVSSYSMEPTLHVGDLILVIGVDSSSINIGDIIIYFDRGEPIVHRVINIKVVDGIRRFLTKGDANSMPDKNPNNPHIWISEDYIAGKVILVIPYLGVVSLAVSVNKSLYVLIIFLLIISIVLSMMPYSRKKKLGILKYMKRKLYKLSESFKNRLNRGVILERAKL